MAVQLGQRTLLRPVVLGILIVWQFAGATNVMLARNHPISSCWRLANTSSRTTWTDEEGKLGGLLLGRQSPESRVQTE